MVVSDKTVDILELKARNPLGDTVEAAGIALRGKGRVRQGVCPFHQETQGSFTVYADSEKFHCYGCGTRGDVLDYISDAGSSPTRMEARPGTTPVRSLSSWVLRMIHSLMS